MSIFQNLSAFSNGMIVGLALAAACSLLSVFIVLRGMAMISEAVAHSGIGGIAVALLLGYFFSIFSDNTWGPVMTQVVTGVFCLTTALLIGYFTKGKHVSEDSAIGIFLVATMALGILLLSIRSKLPRMPNQPPPASIENILFGDIITVTTTEAWIAVGAAIAIFVIILALYNEFLYTTLDEEMARINGVNTRLINVLQLTMISLVIVVGVRMVGAMMITALTVLPGATGRMISRKFNGVIIASLLVGVLGVGTAMLAAINPPLNSYTSGPILVLTLFAIFFVVWAFRQLFKPKVIDAPSTLPAASDTPPHAH